MPIDRDALEQLIALGRERNRARETRLGKWRYLRFDGKVRAMPEGAVVFGETVVWGYPKIGRIVQLDPGIRSQLRHPFWVEEKIDGYNVRIFRHEGEALAITRRGYICPFTTDRLADFIDLRLFGDHPDLVLCAEAAGPENPYNEGSPPFIKEDIKLFVFDMMRIGETGFLPYREKLGLVEAYGLPAAPRFGRFELSEFERLKAIILELDREGREGIVLKEDSPEDRRIKYVSGRSNIADIGVNQGNLQQLPAEYFLHRILRLGLFLEEHAIDVTPEMCRELGQIFIGGTLESIEQFRKEHKVRHTFRCRFRQRANAELMLRDMKRRLGKFQVRQHSLEKEGDFYLLEFEKTLPRSTGVLAQLLGGGLVYD